MTEVIPAIIPQDIEDLEARLMRVRGLSSWVQIDVVDGKFVPQRSWPFHAGDTPSWEQLTSEQEGLPYWQDFLFEADLMIREPERWLSEFFNAGFSRAVVHIESTNDPKKCITLARENDAEIGFALNIDTPEAEILNLASEIDFVQCMGIAEIGVQGNPFDDRVLTKIGMFKAAYPELPVAVDGGVSLESAPALVKAGATRLVSGSAIFNAEHPQEAIEEMRATGDRQ